MTDFFSSLRKFCLFFLLLFLLASFSLSAEGISYSVEFEGSQDGALLREMRKQSQLIALQKKPTATLTALRQRIASDLPNLTTILHDFGYYGGKISSMLKRVNKFGNPSKSALVILLTIEKGPLYSISSFNLRWEGTPPHPLPSAAILGQAALTTAIFEEEKRLLQQLQNSGYPFPKVNHRRLVVNSDQLSVDITLTIDSGRQFFFGETAITGLKRLQESFVRKRIQWKKGELYSLKRLNKTRESLENSSLFSQIKITGEQKKDLQSDKLPFLIELKERPHRTLGAGIGFTTHTGIGAGAEWENRNLLGKGELLRMSGDFSEKQQVALLKYKKPDFLRKQQELSWILQGKQEVTKAYTNQQYQLSSIFERKINDFIALSFGAQLSQERTTNSEQNSFDTLFALPMTFNWRNSDHPLDPKRGSLLRYSFTPYSKLGEELTFYKQKLTGALYLPLLSYPEVNLMTWATLGNIGGKAHLEIPVPHRFFAGSQNGLRGYGFNTVSPLGLDNKPLGGRSLSLYGVEMELHATKNLSFAGFTEAGHVFAETLPRFDQKLLRSWGIGLRYHTPFGPIRLDFAFPLDRRPDLDSPYQFYLTIGPAF